MYKDFLNEIASFMKAEDIKTILSKKRPSAYPFRLGRSRRRFLSEEVGRKVRSG